MSKSDRRNIASVSWGDHLVFGEGDGRLDSVQALKRRMGSWREELKAAVILWRCTRDRIRGRYYAGKGHQHFFKTRKPDINWDDFEVVPEAAHNLGMQIYLYVSLSRRNPQYAVVDRESNNHQWGVLCLAYPEVRRHLIERYQRLLKAGDFDGLFVCFRSQSKPAAYADQFGFNEPIRREYLKRHGKDIIEEDFDLQNWRDLCGVFITLFLRELQKALSHRHMDLAVGLPRGSVLGPPMGNTTLQWPTWIRERIIDRLIVDQNSSQCPSMWHALWPMHRGYGYLQNYLDGRGLNLLEEDLVRTYAPVLDGKDTKLYVARQWQERSGIKEKDLLQQPIVQGLVFSSFRHDNPGAIQRNNWIA
jgi:hypothetical protein